MPPLLHTASTYRHTDPLPRQRQPAMSTGRVISSNLRPRCIGAMSDKYIALCSGTETHANGNSSCSPHSSPNNRMDCLPKIDTEGVNIFATAISVETHENDLVEPYMVLGYEEEQRSEQSWKSKELPQGIQPRKAASELPYSPYNDPVFNRQQWWDYGSPGL